MRTFAADLKNIKILNKIMLTGIFIFLIIAGLLYVVGMIIAAILGGAGAALGVILGYKVTRIILGLGVMALGVWLMYEGWIEQSIHWAWAAFAGIPCEVIGLMLAIHNEKLVYLLPITLLGYGGWLIYAGWIEEDISCAWSAFFGIPLCLGGLALWAFISDENK